jgi:hypothetical protein
VNAGWALHFSLSLVNLKDTSADSTGQGSSCMVGRRRRRRKSTQKKLNITIYNNRFEDWVLSCHVGCMVQHILSVY